MNDELKFFLLAMFAVKPYPGSVIFTPQSDGNIKWEITPGYVMTEFPIFNIHSLGIVVHNEDQAREEGMKVLMEKAPPEDGWILHHVTLNPVSRASLLHIADIATGDHEQTDDDLIVM